MPTSSPGVRETQSSQSSRGWRRHDDDNNNNNNNSTARSQKRRREVAREQALADGLSLQQTTFVEKQEFVERLFRTGAARRDVFLMFEWMDADRNGSLNHQELCTGLYMLLQPIMKVWYHAEVVQQRAKQLM
jgi:hypothetical protein